MHVNTGDENDKMWNYKPRAIKKDYKRSSNEEMVFVGSSTLVVTLLYILGKRIKNNETKLFHPFLLIRISVLILTSVALLYFGMD